MIWWPNWKPPVLIVPWKQWVNKNIQTKLPLRDLLNPIRRWSIPSEGRTKNSQAKAAEMWAAITYCRINLSTKRKICDKMPEASKCRKERVILFVDAGTQCHVTKAALKVCVVGISLDILTSCPQLPSAKLYAHSTMLGREERCFRSWFIRRSIMVGRDWLPGQLWSMPLGGYLPSSQWIHKPGKQTDKQTNKALG